jgi:hypothetical protein
LGKKKMAMSQKQVWGEMITGKSQSQNSSGKVSQKPRVINSEKTVFH